MIHPMEEEATLRLLNNLNGYHSKNKLAKRYYEGTLIPPALKTNTGKTKQVDSSVGWAKIAVDSHVERISLQGFIGAGGEDNPWGVNDVADENGIETLAGEVTKESLIKGTSFVTVAAGADYLDPEVLISAHDSSFATADYSLRSKLILCGLTVFPDDPERGELLTPESIIPFGLHEGKIFLDGERIDHTLGRVPMVQLSNNPDAGSVKGHSEITLPMRRQIDSVIRTLNDLEINRELHAWGQRYLATDQKFTGPDGKPIDPFIAAMQTMWRIPMNTDGSKPEIGTLPSNSPEALLSMLRTFAQTFASEAGLPEYYFGVSPDANPTSADAIRAGESRLIKKATNRTRQISRSWSEVGMLAVLIKEGKLPEDFDGVRPIWGDVTTISPGAAADRAIKLVSAGILQPTSRIVLSELGYGKAQQDTILRENNAATGDLLRKLIEAEKPEAGGEETVKVPVAPLEVEEFIEVA